MQAVGRRLAAAARGLSGAPRAAPVSVAGVHARSALIAAHHSAIPAHGLGAVASRRLLVAASPPGAWAGGLLGPGAARALGPAVRPWLAPPLGAEQTRGMRHGQRRGKLGRSATDRWALLRNMVTDLIKHERIQTTVPKAKELKRLADKVITIGKQGTLMARRRAGAILRTDESIRKLFGVLAPRYRERDGGYTRVLRCINNRKGDNAPMAWIEYVDREGELRTCKAPVKRLPYAKRLHHAQAKGDERLVEYFTEMQGRELEAAAARAARIQAKKIRIRGPDGLD